MAGMLSGLAEPATLLLARLVSGFPGMLVPGLLIIAALLCALVLVDGALDRAGADGAK